MTTDDSSPLKPGTVSVRPGQPLSITPSTEELAQAAGVSDEDRSKVGQVGRTLKAYLQAARDLVAGKYAELRAYVPEHMTASCTPVVVVLNDGIIVRYDPVENPENKVTTGLVQASVREWAPQLSESVVYCPPDPSNFDLSDKGITFQLQRVSAQGNITPISETRMAIIAPIDLTRRQQPSAKPTPLVSVHNEFEMHLEAETTPQEGRPARRFLVRNQFRAAVGWRTIEVYPEFNAATWNPDIATLWAETDLLAAVARHNLLEEQFAKLDPHVAARRQMVELLRQFEEHLTGPEEPLHQFIRQHPQLLSPAYLRVWSKLPLGNRTTDFVFKEPPMDYLLVELERASHLLFRDNGEPKYELTHAINQVTDWLRYIQDNHDTVQRELGLHGISVTPRAIIVIGRRATLTDENARRLVTMETMAPRLRILTYDDLLASARAAAENMFGPLDPILNPDDGAKVYFLPTQ